MPLYEYQCDACGKRFEIIRKFSDPPVTTCPSCGGTVQKLASSPAIQFKGTGWYITDYAKKSGGGDGSRSETKSSGDSAKSDSKTTTDAGAAKTESTNAASESKTPAAPATPSTDSSPKSS